MWGLYRDEVYNPDTQAKGIAEWIEAAARLVVWRLDLKASTAGLRI